MNPDDALSRGAAPAASKRPSLVAWGLTLGGLALCYAPMWLPPLARAFGADLSDAGPAASILWNSAAVAALLGYVLLLERRPLTSIGLRRPRAKDLEWALYLFGGAMAWQWLVSIVWPTPESEGTTTIASLPILAVVGLILSAAIFEEFLFRGYPIERLSELTGRRWLAFTLTVPLFVAPHVVFFGVQWLWTAGVGALAIYALYAKTRNLPACMVLHLCLNAPILIPTIAHHMAG